MTALSIVDQAKIDHERDKYRAMWAHAPYRRFSPGEKYLLWAHQALAPEAGASFIDFGCGTGRAAAQLAKLGHQIIGVDIADNCLDAGIALPLIIGDLARLPDLRADYGICTDVMEHIRPECVDGVLGEIARCARLGVFFSIALNPDAFGAVIGEPLHLTVREAAWWEEKLRARWPFVKTEAIDGNLLATCRHAPSGFTLNVDVEPGCNAAHEQIFANVRVNSSLPGVPWLTSHGVEAHNGHAVMVGGGPSLGGLVEEVRARALAGQTIFALNGAADFLADHGIVADYGLVLDARPENLKFLARRSARRWLLASQCDPSLFAALADADVTLFHWGMEGIQDHIPKGKPYALLAGGWVAGPIAMSAACVLGYRNFHLYGYDSSDAPDGNAHAYAQDETDAERKRLEVNVGGRTFRCSFAMFKQAESFPAFASMLAEHGCVITVHGDGLLPTVARQMMQPAQPQEITHGPS